MRVEQIGRVRLLFGWVFITCWVLLAAMGCAVKDPPEQVSEMRRAVTCDNSAVFGFETASLWSGTSATLTQNSRRIQGNVSLRVQGGSHMEVRSLNTCSVGANYDSLAFYLAATSTSAPAAQVGVSVQLDSPSKGLTAAVVDTKLVTVPEQGHFTRIELRLPDALATALSSAYTDLKIRLIFDAVDAAAQDYLLDDLSLRTAALEAVTGTGPLQTQTFELRLPSEVDVFDLALLGLNELRIADNARIQKRSGGLATVAASGAVTTDLGVSARTGTLVSIPGVSLRNNAVVEGNVVTGAGISCGTSSITGGTIACSNGASVTGQARTQVTLTPLTTLSWRIEYQQSNTWVNLEPNTTRSLNPGPYAGVSVKNGAKLTLSTGTYYFDSLALESGAQLALINDSGPVLIYVRGAVIWRGTLQYLGLAGDLLLAVSGTTPLAIETSFDGTIVAPKADVRMAVGGTPHSGAVFAKSVLIDPQVVFSSRPALPLVGAIGGGSGVGSKGSCGNQFASSPFASNMSPRDLQVALLRYCGGTDTGPCETALLAQINLDYFSAAQQLVFGTLPISKHFAFILDRERKTRLIHGNEALACQILNDDPDGDFVPTPIDSCPGTPPLTATLQNGCPDPANPDAPPLAEVLDALPTLAITTDPRCIAAPSPELASPFGAWRFPSDPSNGKAVWISQDPDTSGCPQWYIIEAKLTDGSIQTVGFSPEEDTDLPWIQRADNILQFNIHASAGGARGAWARYDVYTDRYRVLAVNGAGKKSPWSNWFRPGQEGCAAGACSDF